MDFNSVITMAKSNKSNGVVGRGYNPATSSVKKVQDKKNVESNVVKAYLEKKKREEQMKAIEAERKKRNLLELRATAHNSRKANIMAKRTKDNNFMAYLSVSEQLARDAEMNNHKNYLPVKKSVNLNDKLLIGKTSSTITKNGSDNEALERKVRRPPPPPVFNYGDLLNIAATTKNLPAELPRIPKKKVNDVDVQGRLMTNEEKRKFLEEHARKQGKSVSAIALPKKSKRGPRYNGEENNFVVGSMAGEIPLAGKCPQKSVNQPARSSKQLVDSNQNRNGSQQKVMPKFLNQQKQASVPPPAANEQNKCKPANIKPTQDHRFPKKSQPSVSKTSTRSLGVKYDQKSSANVQLSKTNRSTFPQSKTQQKVSNGAPSTRFGKNPRSTSTVDSQRGIEKQTSIKFNKNIPTKSKSSDVEPPLRRNMMSQMSKTNLERCNSKQPVQQRPTNPPQQRLQQSNPASRQSLGSRESLSMRPPQRTAPHPRPQPRGSPSMRPPQRGLPNMRPPQREPPSMRPQPGGLHRRPPLNPSLRPPMKRRIESEDEYDEEMDDFIDDGPVDGYDCDYSSHIKEIFGYDRSRYTNDRDDDITESSFAQQMKEEAISSRMGLLEDLEDIQREQDELNRSRKKRKKLK